MRWIIPFGLVVMLVSCGYTGPLSLPKEPNKPIEAIPTGPAVLDQSEPVANKDSYSLENY